MYILVFIAIGVSAISMASGTYDYQDQPVNLKTKNWHYDPLHTGWKASQRIISQHEFVTDSPEEDEHNILRQYWTNDRIKSTDTTDCVFRGNVRSFPGECYNRDYNVEKPKTKWWTVWNEIAHDFSYTFDFVLAPVTQEALSFYFMIMFLKSLASFIDNPLDVLGHQRFQRDMIELNSQMIDSIRHYEDIERNMTEIRYMCNDLIIDMQKFQDDKSKLHTNMVGLKTALAQYDIGNRDVEDKLNDINIQTNSLQGIIESLGNTMLTKFYPVNDGTLVLPQGFQGPQQKKQQVKSITFPTNIVANVKGPEIDAR